MTSPSTITCGVVAASNVPPPWVVQAKPTRQSKVLMLRITCSSTRSTLRTPAFPMSRVSPLQQRCDLNSLQRARCGNRNSDLDAGGRLHPYRQDPGVSKPISKTVAVITPLDHHQRGDAATRLQSSVNDHRSGFGNADLERFPHLVPDPPVPAIDGERALTVDRNDG